MNFEETSRILAVISMAIPSTHNRDLRGTATVWQEIFANDDYYVVKAATVRYLNYCKDWPTPAHIRENIEAIVPRQNQPTPLDNAWSEVMGFIRSHGYMNPPKLNEYSHKAVFETVSAIGWLEICTNENIEATRSHFMKLYTIKSKRAEEERKTDQAIGLMPPKESGAFRLVENVSKKLTKK